MFEHVPPPVERAFSSALRLLKPNGVLVFTVPYSLDPGTAEHFPAIGRIRARAGWRSNGASESIARRQARCYRRRLFHVGCTGPAPELREFSEAGLRATVGAAGFSEFRIYSDDYPEFGIVQAEAWSLPMAARRGPFGLSADAARDIVEHWRDAHLALKRVGGSRWFRAGRKLGFCK